MTQQATKTRQTQHRRGFTLLELITVMGIIVAMSAIVVGGYRGMMRAIAHRAGVDALVKAVTLCRQYATIDGQDTYFWITGFDKYVICRKAGQVDSNTERVRKRSLEDYEWKASGYLSSSANAYWITDTYSDLGSAQTHILTMADGNEGLDVEAMRKKEYDAGLAFDFTEGKVARIRFPPWFVAEHGYWIIGLMSAARDDDPGCFKVNNEYGWMVGPEYSLPKGYVFDSAHYTYRSRDGEFQEGERFFFRPDGTLGENSNKRLVINEIGTNKKPSVTIRQDGVIDWNYDE
ncbi:MAG: pilus assembly FimT family protein [Kiritimatiellia bacterium]|jgi:prepilin-type N-terminal cleavage/methylation domain-containing protein